MPLKSRPAPYHIPRSPHYSISHSDHPHTSPNPHLQPQPSPAASCQASPSPSSSSVKSPTPVLAPIPNPIPSPGISGLRSPCNQGMSPCGTQRSPAHMGSTYSGHGQGGPPTQCGGEGPPLHHGIPKTDTQHYSPCGMTPTHNFPPFSVSPSRQRSSSVYSPSCDPSSISNPEQLHQVTYSSPSSSSPCSNNLSSYIGSSKFNLGQSTSSHTTVPPLHMSNNPLVSLQKLVMLPETQVVDPKSVVNDTCLSSQQDESPKNVNGPAEWLAESSGHSVGFQDQSSSLRSPQCSSHRPQSQNFDVADGGTTVSANSLCTSYSGSLEQKQLYDNVDSSLMDTSSRHVHQGINTNNNSAPSHQELHNQRVPKPVEHSGDNSRSFENVHSVTDHIEPSELKQEKLESVINGSDCNPSGEDAACLDGNKTEIHGPEQAAVKPPTPSPLTEDETTDKKALTGGSFEKTPETDNQGSLFPLERKNGRVKEDPKCLMVQCHSPNVLSEMPVMINELSGTACGNDDDLEQDCGNGVHTRLQNAFSSLVKAKLARVKKVAQFACVTPCSIAVGADERAACERFAFRRNGFCRTLRTSRVIYNGRSRNDSTGNGDSDESLENMSEGSFGHSESPQDGNRKRPPVAAKKNDRRKPGLSSVSSTSEVAGSKSRPAEPVTSSSNGCVSYSNEAMSDDDTCYYEGVDSSDIFINNCSSDESVTSSGELKHKVSAAEAADKANENQGSLLTPAACSDDQNKKQEDKTDKGDVEFPLMHFDEKHSTSPATSSSPPSKRLRRSSGQKAQEKVKVFSSSRRSCNNSLNENAKTVIDLTSDNIQKANTASFHSKSEQVAFGSLIRNSKEQDRVSNKFRPLILGHSRTAGKYPVVILEKSNMAVAPSPVFKEENVEQADQLETISAQEESCNLSTAVAYAKDLPTHDAGEFESELKLEDESMPITFGDAGYDGILKTDIVEDGEIKDVEIGASSATAAPENKVRKKPPKRKTVKSRHQTKVPQRVNRDTEVKDSFKSMKFSRTLDLMKSRRKREQTSIGPFVRIVGKQSAPESVAVFIQPTHESLMGLTSGKHKHFKNKNAHPQSAATTIHMVTSIPADKEAMVSSARTISNNPWVCAFCAQHSSYRFLGDLFGPYFKESDIQKVEDIAAEESKKGDSVKEQKLSDCTLTRRSRESILPERKSSRRGKLQSQSKPSRPNTPPPEEVWVHEACAMWSPGVYLIGNKIYGLDEAVKDAAETVSL